MCRLSGHPCTQRLRMQSTQDLGWPTGHIIQETQRRPTLARERCSPLHGLAKASRLLQHQARPETPLLRVQYSRSQGSWVSSSAERLRRLPHIIQKLGRTNFAKQASQKNTRISSQGSVTVFASVFLSLTTHNLPLIKILWLSSQLNSTELYKTKYRKDIILVQSQDETWRPLSVHSNPHHFLSFRNQDELTNTGIFKTTHSQAPPPTNSPIHPSTHRSTRTCSLQHGAHLLLSHFSYTDCHQAHNWPLETLRKPTEPFLSITLSGHPQLSTWEMMHLQSTLHWPLGQDLQLGRMAQLEMLPQTFCSSKKLVQSLVGSTITYSSRSLVVHFQSTTRNAGHGMETSFPEVSTKREVESGSEEGDLKMELLKNLTKTAPFLARTFQHPQIDQWKIGHTPTTLTILTLHHACWGSHGRSRRTDPSLVQRPTSVSTGTSKPIEYLWQIARKKNTLWRQRIGFCKPHIHLKRWRNSMANSYMHALSGPLDEHISRSWSACLEYSTIVHSYHTPVQGDFEKTWNGGSTSFNNPSCQPQSLSLFPSTIRTPSQTQALNSESQSPLETSGGHGASYQAGRHLMDSEILDGWRPLPLNAWSGTSRILTARSNTSWCTVTTEELLKVGGMGGVTVDQSTKYSRNSMNSPGSAQLGPLSTQCMLGANSIPQMHPPEGYIHQNPFSFHQRNSHQSSITSSLTHNPLSQQLNYMSKEKSQSTGPPKDSKTMLTRGLTIAHDNAVLISAKNLAIPTDNSLTKFNQPLLTDKG